MIKKMICAVAAAFCWAGAWAQPIPEQPQKQKATYDEVKGVVTVEAEMPKYLYDNEAWTYADLEKIDYLLIERHISGTGWSNNVVTTKLENPPVGEMISWEDKDVVADCKYEYRLTCYADEVKGYSAYVTAYTGVIPGALEHFKARTASPEATSITFTITAPSTSQSGNPLSSNMSITLQSYADWTYTDLHTFTDVAPGSTITWELPGLTLNKNYYFRAMACNGVAGNGEASSADVYVGLDLPGELLNVKAVPVGDDRVELSWEMPETGSRGGSYAPEQTVVHIARCYYEEEREWVALDEEGTTFTDIHGLSEEATVTYYLIAVNDAGESLRESAVGPISTGKPAKLPFKESFAESKLDHKGWTMESSQDDPYYTYKAWKLYSIYRPYHWVSDSYLEINPHDWDEGYAVCLFYSYSPEGQTESLISPAIDLDGTDDAELRFHYYDIDKESSGNMVRASVSADGGPWKELYVSEPDENVSVPEWKEVVVALDVPKDTKQVRVRLDAIRGGIPVIDMFIDDITVQSASTGAIDAVATDGDEDAAPEYFNLQGMRIAAPAKGQIAIERRGNKVEKKAF